MTVPHIAFVGYSGSGKTTLAAAIVRLLKADGWRVGTLKHDAHEIELDTEGKDTFRYAEAGADVVMVASPNRLYRMERLQRPLSLAEALRTFSGLDLVIVEGFKRETGPKILVARTPEQLALLDELDGIVAVAASIAVEQADVPVFGLHETERITAFVKKYAARA